MGQKIFLTGASAGIGLLTTQALLARGHEVWGTARDVARLPRLDRFHPVALDLTDAASCEQALRGALAEAGHFDVLINNAGAGVFGPLESFSDDEFRRQWELLVAGPLRLIRLILPSLRECNAGLIVNVASLAAEFPLPFLAPYSIGKAALGALSEGLALELAHTGIRVIDVRPGDFSTDFHTSTQRIGDALAPAYQPNLENAWKAIDHNMTHAPDPRQVSDVLVKIVEGRVRRPVVAVGDIFQARIAPFLVRLVPRGWVRWGLRLYYGLKSGRR
jgi:NAD(P)-dependent dehydrogenase (short-subunit alcohol dehydrogenase family)